MRSTESRFWAPSAAGRRGLSCRGCGERAELSGAGERRGARRARAARGGEGGGRRPHTHSERRRRVQELHGGGALSGAMAAGNGAARFKPPPGPPKRSANPRAPPPESRQSLKGNGDVEPAPASSQSAARSSALSKAANQEGRLLDGQSRRQIEEREGWTLRGRIRGHTQSLFEGRCRGRRDGLDGLDGLGWGRRAPLGSAGTRWPACAAPKRR